MSRCQIELRRSGAKKGLILSQAEQTTMGMIQSLLQGHAAMIPSLRQQPARIWTDALVRGAVPSNRPASSSSASSSLRRYKRLQREARTSHSMSQRRRQVHHMQQQSAFMAPPPSPSGRIPGTDQAVRGGRHGQKVHYGSPPPPAGRGIPAVVRMPAGHGRRFKGERPIGAATGQQSQPPRPCATPPTPSGQLFAWFNEGWKFFEFGEAVRTSTV